LIRNVAVECKGTLTDFIFKFPAQIALLGLQLLWTMDAEDALSRAKVHRKDIDI